MDDPRRSRSRRAGLPLMLGAALIGAACTAPAGAGPSPEVTTSTSETPSAAPNPDPASESSPLPDVTARPIGIEELTAMLPLGDTGVAATADDRVVSTRSNEDLVTSAVFDRDDESEDVAAFGRITGVAAVYHAPGYDAHVWIDLFDDVAGARGWVSDTAGDITKHLGGSHAPGIDLADAVEYPIEGIGEKAVGLILALDGGSQRETIALFSMGRLAVFASVVRGDDTDARVLAQYLAEEVADRILAVLLDDDTALETRSAGPSGYRFAFERVVSIGNRRFPTTASGRVSAGDVACRVRMEQPDLVVEREYVSVGGTIWTRLPGTSEYESRGSAGALDAVLLSLCPAWPLHVFDAGLSGATDGTPARYEVGGTPALGYLGTPEDLAAALGEGLAEATIDVFNVWVAEGSPWLVELDLAVSGSAERLTELTGPGYQPSATVRVTIRHQVTDLDAVEPVTPPG